MKNIDFPIDFVIPWVDGNDTVWQEEKRKYWEKLGKKSNNDANNAARYRDWDNLKFWFRAVEKFAPWVNNVYFVTNGQCPEWLNLDHPKLKFVKHSDFIPQEYLPTFQANPIEDNFHRIEGLSEHFVYFNDDMFLTAPVSPSDFFVNGFPREMAIQYPLVNGKNNDTFNHMLLTMSGYINGQFNIKSSIRKNFFKWYNLRYGRYLLSNIMMSRSWAMSGLIIPHTPSALRVSTMKEVWEKLPDPMHNTCLNKFRETNDITQYMFRYWEMMKGTFEPTNIFKYSMEFHIENDTADKICSAITNQKYKMICINDSVNIDDIENAVKSVNSAFETIFPEKSGFEK